MKTALIILAVVIAFTVLMVMYLPRRFVVERSILIAAPPSKIFEVVADLSQRPKWTAWFRKEPDAVVSNYGEPGKKNSAFGWRGREIGEGVVTIVEIIPDQLVRTRLEFKKPFQMISTDVFELAQADLPGQTKLIWRNEGELAGMQRLIGLFLDRMIGADYVEGLANLKQQIENK